MSDRNDEIAEVLAAHVDYGLYSDFGGDTHYVCACDETKRPGTHRTHLAAVLAERERRVKAEVLREAAAACRRMADQAEIDAGGKLDRWDAFSEAEDWLCDKADRIEGQ